MNKMLWRCEQAICLRNLFEAEVCVESLFAFGDNVVGWWVGACRSVLHTQETPNTHKAFRIAASNPWGSKTDEEMEGL